MRGVVNSAMPVGVALFLLVSFMAETGCGRKSAPLPPEIRVADTTRDLQVVQDGAIARLQWSYPQMTSAGGPLSDLEAIEVWRAEIPLPQEPPAGRTAKEREVRWNLLEARGEIITRLESENLDLATKGPNLVLEDGLNHWVSPSEEAPPDSIVLWYAVRSVCCRGRLSDFSNIVRLIPKAAPPAPEGLEVVAENDGPHLQWTPVEDRLVQIERSEEGGQWKVVSASPLTEAVWIDGEATQGKTWFYRLRSVELGAGGAVVRMGDPGPSVRLDFPDLYPPDQPADLVCLPEGGQVRLRWQAAAGATGYRIERKTDSTKAVVLAEAIVDVFYLDEEPPAGKMTYIVRAVDGGGNSSPVSRCITIVEAPQ